MLSMKKRFGFFTRTGRWGITELKNDLRSNWLPELSDDTMKNELLDKAIRVILKALFVDNYGKFNEIDKQILANMFDSVRYSLDDIEYYLRLKLGKSYDKKVKRNLGTFYERNSFWKNVVEESFKERN